LGNIHELKEEIEKTVEPAVKDNFMELVEVELGGGHNLYVRIRLDKIEGGISLEDCARMGHLLGDVLDAAGTISGNYTLEVSSPGLDRPLKKPSDFKRFEGKLAKVITKEPVDNMTVFIGRLKDAAEDAVTVQMENKETRISFDSIKKAFLEIEF
jgi:ribosome maturation factor RimP